MNSQNVCQDIIYVNKHSEEFDTCFQYNMKTKVLHRAEIMERDKLPKCFYIGICLMDNDRHFFT